jgi:hypothetical protein
MITVKDLREKDLRDINVNLGYTVLALVTVARWALENDTSGINVNNRNSSVAIVLEVVETLTEQMIDGGEAFERELKRGYHADKARTGEAA